MAIREILQLGNEILLEKSEKVSHITSDEITNLIIDLKDTLMDFRSKNGFGRGIAAPQIGVLKKVIYINMADGQFERALINPEIVWADDRQYSLWDTCFSFPNLIVRVERARAITVNYINEKDMPRTIDADGDLSELLQHEIDHLDGILTVKRAISDEAFMTREEWLRQGKPV